MEAVQAAGLTKSIGVSNYLPSHLAATLKTAKVKPVCNQIELHPYLQRQELLEFHKQNGIATTAYGPLSAATKAKPGPLDDYVEKLTKKYAVSENEIYLRWCIDQDIVPVTTSGKEQRLSDYLRVMTFKLTPKEVKEMNELGQQKHYRGFWNDKVRFLGSIFVFLVRDAHSISSSLRTIGRKLGSEGRKRGVRWVLRCASSKDGKMLEHGRMKAL